MSHDELKKEEALQLQENDQQPEEEIQQGFPSEDEIKEMKSRYGDLEAIEIAGDTYIYRRLTAAEHKTMVNTGFFENAEDPDRELVKRLLVWPNPKSIVWDKLGAGVIPTLSQAMMRFAGFIQTAQPRKL